MSETTTETTEPTLVALDVSEFVVADTPEVAVLKEKVKAVAKKYTERHGWCDEVKRALKEIGIGDAKPVTVDLTLHPLVGGGTIAVAVDPSLLLGKTAVQQQKVLAKTVADVRAYQSSELGGNYTTTLALAPEVVVGMALRPMPVPGQVQWVRLANNARVLHVVVDDNGTSRWVESSCGRASAYRNDLPNNTGSITKKCTACARKHPN
jgi:hypothetical protein